MKQLLNLSLCLVLLCSFSACLKTRAQLKEDTDREEASQPVPAKVEEVQPQGQYVIDEIKSELTRMTGRIEELERAHQQSAGANSDARKEDLKKLETRINELEQAQTAVLESLKKLQASAPVADSPELFEKGKAQYKAGNFEEAAESFSGYLKAQNPKHLEEATFLRAEAYYELKQYKKAIVDYSKFPEKFHRSRRMSTALYKIGLSFDAMGMREDAKGFYQELVEKFPQSGEAKKARKKIK